MTAKTGPRPRLLLVEDDPSLQRFVTLALSELDLDLRCCAEVDAALAALALEPVELIVTDLMLPGRSGFELLEALAAAPALRGSAALLVYSAGLVPPVRERLAAVGVRYLLAKPCTVTQLEEAVRRALGQSSAAAAPPADDRAGAVARHFGGNQALYDAYRDGCLRQFATDIAAGDTALAAGDGPGLRRLAHNLKSVLLLLGHAAASEQARRLEDSALAGDWAQARAQWLQLRAALQAFAKPREM